MRILSLIIVSGSTLILIIVSGSTSAIKSLSSSVFVKSSFSASNGVKWSEWAGTITFVFALALTKVTGLDTLTPVVL